MYVVGQRRAPEERPRRRRGQPGLRRRGPVGAEGRLERRDALGDARQDGMSVACVADRRLEHVAKRGRPELEQHAEPGVERTGHAGGEQPRAGDEVEPELSEALGRRGGGRRSLAADDEHVVARRRSRERSAGRRRARSGAARRPAARTPPPRRRRTRCRRPRAVACRPRTRASGSRRPSRTCRGALVVS